VHVVLWCKMRPVFTAAYWRDLAERMVSSFAGAMVAAYGADGLNLLSLDWRAALGIGLGAAFVSLLKGLAARTLNSPETASLVATAPSTVTAPGYVQDPDVSGH
jgi:cyanate permease